MADQTLTFTAIVTTGPSPAEDRVLEAAAVRIAQGKEVAEFGELAKPGALSPAVKQLTELRDSDVSGKAEPGEVLARWLEFCAEDHLIVYDAATAGTFLDAEGQAVPAWTDALPLARIVCPRADDYSLGGIARSLELDPVPARRAGPQARLLARVWSTLLEELAKLPPAALDAIYRVAEAANDPLAPVLEQTARGGDFQLAADPETGLVELFADHRKLLSQAQKYEQPEPSENPIPTDGICRMFSSRGLIGQKLPQYEERVEQVDMARAVCEALNEPRHLVVEAGTGTGKSLAYLVPAIAWACTNGDKVLVSTNTRNLQEQLYGKDLPFLTDILPGRFEPALLKGRRNYLCVRRFLHLMRHFDRELAEPEEYAALAPLISWAARVLRASRKGIGPIGRHNRRQPRPALRRAGTRQPRAPPLSLRGLR
ncbi:MAG: DEAD/DEAH box helicase [Planctomycetota bacterium]|jgi:ATP-dependent DNA helicase DinG